MYNSLPLPSGACILSISHNLLKSYKLPEIYGRLTGYKIKGLMNGRGVSTWYSCVHSFVKTVQFISQTHFDSVECDDVLDYDKVGDEQIVFGSLKLAKRFNKIRHEQTKSEMHCYGINLH